MPKSQFVEKIQDLLDKYFYKIFNDSHALYTVFFFISALLIALISLAPNAGNAVLFLAFMFAIAFFFLMIFGIVPQFNDYLFSAEKKLDRNKIFFILISLGIGFLIVLLYFLLGASANLPIQFLGWDLLLPPILILIYFGWNLIQIFFLKTGFEELSVKANNKILQKYEHSKNMSILCVVFLILGLMAPILMQIGTFAGFWSKFEPLPGDSADLLYWYVGWNIIMFIIIAITSWRLISLFIRSRKNETPNVFSSLFYMLIWIIIWYRSFSFINSFSSATGDIDIFRQILDLVLLVFTAILVLRSLGGKVYNFRLFNMNNMPFFLFSFTILYIGGQIIMITGAGSLTGLFSDTKQVSMINNFLMLIISLMFYLWYSEYVLEKKNLIMRRRFNSMDVLDVLTDYKVHLESIGALETARVSEDDLKNFLEMKHISIASVEELTETDFRIIKDEIESKKIIDEEEAKEEVVEVVEVEEAKEEKPEEEEVTSEEEIVEE